MSEMQLPEMVTLALEDIHPYANNPRRIPAEAVAAVQSSLEKYGYQQPIVVDDLHVIIVGHTRYLALKEMGVKQVPVYVADLPPDKANAYRLADNRTGEGSEWDHSSLVMELREFEQGLIEEFFSHVNLELDVINAALSDVTDKETRDATDSIGALKPTVRDPLTTQVICPACYEAFKVRTDSLPGLSRLDLEQLEVTADGVPQAK